jgi:peptide/nickel transport system substrate-binding protein
MQYWYGLRMKPVAWLLPILAFTLVLGIACGSAAQTTDAEPAADNSGAAAPPAAAMTQPTAVPATAPEQPAAMTDVHPGTVTWMIGGLGSENFDYTFDVGGSNNYIRFFGGFLVETTETAELVPGIATDWGVSEDGLTWTVTIRDDVKFHDGTDLTAEDVWWTWCHQWCPDAKEYATQSGAQSRARIMDRIEQAGPNKVTMTTTIADGSIPTLSLSAASSSPWVILPKRAEQHVEADVEAYAKNPIGAGPMRLTRHVPAEVMEFERFDDYYYQPDLGFDEDRRVKFSNLELRLVPEEATRVAAIRAEEADVAPASLDAREQVEAGGGRLVFGREGIYFRVMVMGCWQELNYPCSDKRVRHALDYAIDKETIRDELFGGPEVMEVKGWASTTPSTIGYTEELDPWPFDPDKARELFAEAGYKTPTNPGGKDFGQLIVNTWTSTAMPFLPESAQLAAEFWRRELGIDTEVRVGDESALKKATLAQELNGQILWRDNEARVDAGGGRSSYGTPDHTSRLHNNPELFETVQKAIAVTNPEKRAETLAKLYLRQRDESFELGVGYINIPWAVGSRVADWQPFSLAFYPSGIHTLVLNE